MARADGARLVRPEAEAVLIALVVAAWAEEPVVFPPIAESATSDTRWFGPPRYVDAAGNALSWGDVRDLADGTGALPKVHRRQLGRNLVRVMFVGATALEVWGVTELAEREKWTAYPLGAQAGLTGLCSVLSFTTGGRDRAEDRAIVVNAVNGAWVRRR